MLERTPASTSSGASSKTNICDIHACSPQRVISSHCHGQRSPGEPCEWTHGWPKQLSKVGLRVASHRLGRRADYSTIHQRTATSSAGFALPAAIIPLSPFATILHSLRPSQTSGSLNFPVRQFDVRVKLTEEPFASYPPAAALLSCSPSPVTRWPSVPAPQTCPLEARAGSFSPL